MTGKSIKKTVIRQQMIVATLQFISYTFIHVQMIATLQFIHLYIYTLLYTHVVVNMYETCVRMYFMYVCGLRLKAKIMLIM